MQKLLTLTLALCVIFLLIGLLPIHGEAELYENVLRLHVLANSDSEEDQAVKLTVRDAVLAEAARLMEGCTSREEAETVARENLSRLREAAEGALRACGHTDEVQVELGEEVYPTRNYESFCFPAGSYLSLRVLIGAAEGQNWWCVLFPPMCLSAASAPAASNTSPAEENAYISVGLTDSQYRIITETDSPTYSVRFRLLEVIEEALRKD